MNDYNYIILNGFDLRKFPRPRTDSYFWFERILLVTEFQSRVRRQIVNVYLVVGKRVQWLFDHVCLEKLMLTFMQTPSPYVQ